MVNGDILDGNSTNKDHKKWDPTEPIHRINSPAFNDGRFQFVTGDGVSRGCRLPAGPATGRLRRVLPAWVTVQDAAYKEVEGKLVRSFQTWTDFPLLQWHQWYDWNFHVVPTGFYMYLRGGGNQTPSHGSPVVTGETMECEWDTGAFGNFNSPFGDYPGPMFPNDWAWPMAEQFVWLAGRWIYDCGHANSRGLMRSELHPCCAVASARWEASTFQGSTAKQLYPSVQDPLGYDLPLIPGVQFTFFASRFGGYVNMPEVFDRDYEFIVDLPKETVGRTVAPIGPTATFPLNTLTVGPLRIVAQVDFTPFSTARGPVNNSLQPILDVIVPQDGSFPNQVKIKIPLSQLKGTGSAYGVRISFGVFDQTLAVAKRIVKISGTFDTVQFRDDFGPVILNFGINGRWHRRSFNNVKAMDSRPLNATFEFALSLDHPPGGGGQVFTSSHGRVIKKVGEFMANQLDRTLRFGSPPVAAQWVPDIVNPQNDLHKVDDLEVTIAGQLSGTATAGHLSGEQNVPLGIADVEARAANLSLSADDFSLNGKTMDEDEQLAELFFKGSSFVDYVIKGKITSTPA